MLREVHLRAVCSGQPLRICPGLCQAFGESPIQSWLSGMFPMGLLTHGKRVLYFCLLPPQPTPFLSLLGSDHHISKSPGQNSIPTSPETWGCPVLPIPPASLYPNPLVEHPPTTSPRVPRASPTCPLPHQVPSLRNVTGAMPTARNSFLLLCSCPGPVAPLNLGSMSFPKESQTAQSSVLGLPSTS
jgi:hypothetical protein